MPLSALRLCDPDADFLGSPGVEGTAVFTWDPGRNRPRTRLGDPHGQSQAARPSAPPPPARGALLPSGSPPPDTPAAGQGCRPPVPALFGELVGRLERTLVNARRQGRCPTSGSFSFPDKEAPALQALGVSLACSLFQRQGPFTSS